MPHNEGEVTATSIHHRYLGRGKVRISIETEAGEKAYIISTRLLVRSINSAIACMRNNASPVLRELARAS